MVAVCRGSYQPSLKFSSKRKPIGLHRTRLVSQVPASSSPSIQLGASSKSLIRAGLAVHPWRAKMADGQIVKLRPAARSFGGPSIVYVVRRRRRTSVVASLRALDRPVQVSSLALTHKKANRHGRIYLSLCKPRLGLEPYLIVCQVLISGGECLLAGLTLIAPLGV